MIALLYFVYCGLDNFCTPKRQKNVRSIVYEVVKALEKKKENGIPKHLSLD